MYFAKSNSLSFLSVSGFKKNEILWNILGYQTKFDIIILICYTKK